MNDNIETLDVNGVKFVSCALLDYATIDNATIVARANVRTLTDFHPYIKISLDNVQRSNVGGISANAVLSEAEWSAVSPHHLDVELSSRLAALKDSPLLLAVSGKTTVQAWINSKMNDEICYIETILETGELNREMTIRVQDEMNQDALVFYAAAIVPSVCESLGRQVVMNNFQWEMVLSDAMERNGIEWQSGEAMPNLLKKDWAILVREISNQLQTQPVTA